MIIGVTGFFAAGKDTVAEILIKKGFEHVSLSDMIRRELHERGEEITIPNLRRVGNALREQHGPGILGERAAEALADADKAVVTSIRHPAEVSALRRKDHFTMVFVDAPVELRFERSRERSRPGDPETLEAFKQQEEQQMVSADKNAQNLSACREMADRVIVNDGSYDDLARKIDELVETLS